MALLEQISEKPKRIDASSKDKVICPRYIASEQSARCVHYNTEGNGACNLEDVLMCVEWLRKKGKLEACQETLDAMTGHKPEHKSEAKPVTVTQTSARQKPVTLDQVKPQDLVALASLGITTHFQQSDGSNLRVVPSKNEDDLALDANAKDVEITYEDLAHIVTLAHAIPGTRLSKITRNTKGR